MIVVFLFGHILGCFQLSLDRTEFALQSGSGATAVLSTWGNGELGPLCVCVASGALTQTFIQDVNSSSYGQVLIVESGTESPYMTEDTMLMYLKELLAPASWLRLKFNGTEW